MTIIHEAIVPRTLTSLVARYAKAPKGTRVEAWLFEDEPSRRRAESELAAHGVTARLRSAYKPLVHYLLEETDLAALTSIDIAFPVVEDAHPNRFRQEAYPLAGLIGAAKIAFEPAPRVDISYHVRLTRHDGSVQTHRVFAPNRRHEDCVGETQLSPTGWIIENGAGAGMRLATDYETLFEGAMAAIRAHGWGAREPYFEELNIAASVPAQDRRLPCGDESISLAEGLHEDFYFSLLEVFQRKAGRPLGDRRLQPGQIVPEIRIADGDLRVRVETRPLSRAETPVPVQPLASASASLGAAQVRRELEAVGGEPFTAPSRAGRVVAARYRRGTDRAVMISAGQHANETTPIVGAFRAAHILARRDGAHFTISPLENPDGSEVHKRLCVQNPRHMHHAARYTALGDDLEYREGEVLYEKAIRLEAERLSGALLHLNLHGYPSHEWTRPLSGYLPRGFAHWTLPKGYYLILRCQNGWEATGEELLDRVTRHLASVPGLLDFTQAQLRLHDAHAGDPDLRVFNGFPCTVQPAADRRVPLTLITEYPDETIYGDAFIAGHTAQMETVLAAYEAFQTMNIPAA